MPDASIDDMRETLTEWLRARLNAPDLAITRLAAPSSTGFSTDTAYVDIAYAENGRPRARSLVARFENVGPALFLHADIRLQWNMIAGMARHPSVPTPTPVGLELDRTLLGRAFSVVELVPGRPAPQTPNYNLTGWIFDLAPSRRGDLWRNAIEAMARVHEINWRDGFAFLDEPARGASGLEQMLDWTQDWYDWARRGQRHPLIDLAFERLRREQPKDAPTEVLWGDASPNNMLFRDDLTVSAVLDWEAAALGPGESDLAWWLFHDTYLSEGFGIPRLAGLPDRDESIAIYAAARSRPIGDMAYYELLAHTRNAVLSMRSVNRQVELGRIPADTRATTHNPISRLLALQLGVEPAPVGEDYDRYLQAVLSVKGKGGGANKTARELLSPTGET